MRYEKQLVESFEIVEIKDHKRALFSMELPFTEGRIERLPPIREMLQILDEKSAIVSEVLRAVEVAEYKENVAPIDKGFYHYKMNKLSFFGVTMNSDPVRVEIMIEKNFNLWRLHSLKILFRENKNVCRVEDIVYVDERELVNMRTDGEVVYGLGAIQNKVCSLLSTYFYNCQ